MTKYRVPKMHLEYLLRKLYTIYFAMLIALLIYLCFGNTKSSVGHWLFLQRPETQVKTSFICMYFIFSPFRSWVTVVSHPLGHRVVKVQCCLMIKCHW